MHVHCVCIGERVGGSSGRQAAAGSRQASRQPAPEADKAAGNRPWQAARQAHFQLWRRRNLAEQDLRQQAWRGGRPRCLQGRRQLSLLQTCCSTPALRPDMYESCRCPHAERARPPPLAPPPSPPHTDTHHHRPRPGPHPRAHLLHGRPRAVAVLIPVRILKDAGPQQASQRVHQWADWPFVKGRWSGTEKPPADCKHGAGRGAVYYSGRVSGTAPPARRRGACIAVLRDPRCWHRAQGCMGERSTPRRCLACSATSAITPLLTEALV